MSELNVQDLIKLQMEFPIIGIFKTPTKLSKGTPVVMSEEWSGSDAEYDLGQIEHVHNRVQLPKDHPDGKRADCWVQPANKKTKKFKDEKHRLGLWHACLLYHYLTTTLFAPQKRADGGRRMK